MEAIPVRASAAWDRHWAVTGFWLFFKVELVEFPADWMWDVKKRKVTRSFKAVGPSSPERGAAFAALGRFCTLSFLLSLSNPKRAFGLRKGLPRPRGS